MTYRDHNIDAPENGTGEYHTTCPECSPHRTKKTDKCLSVNMDKRVWKCHHCGWSGGLGIETVHTGLPPVPTPKTEPEPERLNTQPLTPDAVKWLASRGLSPKTAEMAGLRSCLRFFPRLNREAPALAIPFSRDGRIVNWKFRALTEKAFTQTRGGDQCLYGWDWALGNRRLVLTEGEIDALSACEAGHLACSCPSGAPPADAKDVAGKLKFVDEAEAVFGGADNIVLATDADAPGVKWREALADKLGRERCWTVTYPENCKDLNDVLVKHGCDAVRDVIATAKPYPVAGLATFEDFADDILAYYRHHDSARGLSTGWVSLDEHVRLRTGTIYIVTGIPSSGKSEWLDQVMLNSIAEHDWAWAVFSPENYPPPVHFQKLAEKWHRKPLWSQWSIPAMTEADVREAIARLSQRIHLLTIDERPSTIDDLLARLKVCVVRHGIKGFILDPYNEMEHARPSNWSETEYISSFLSSVRNFTRIHDVAAFVVAHPTKLQRRDDGSYPVPSPYDISASAHWRNKADVCIAVWRDYDAQDGRVEIHVQKVRDKMLGRPGTVNLWWQRATGVFYETEVRRDEETRREHF